MASRKKRLAGRDESGKESKGVVFITGAGGRLGRKMARYMLTKGYSVRGLVRKRESINSLPAGVVPYVGDINEREVLREACDGADIVLHLAGIVSEYTSTTKEIINANVEGTRSLLEASSRSSVSHFIFASSVDVYGRRRKGLLTEESALKPSDKYGYSKMLAERVIEEYKESVDSTVFRIATIYGQGFESSFFKILRLIRAQKAYMVGNGENHLALVHLTDIESAFGLAIEKRISKGRIYNLSDGHNYTQRYLYNLVADALSVERPSRSISPVLVRILAKAHNINTDELRFLTSDRMIDVSLIKEELGFVPKVDINEGSYDIIHRFLAAQSSAKKM